MREGAGNDTGRGANRSRRRAGLRLRRAGNREAERLPGSGFAIGLLLGILGVVIVALMPETGRAKAARAQRQYQGEVAAAQRHYEIQAEAARRAGYPFPPQPPQGPWQLYQDWSRRSM